jgi:beta-galactosidase
MKLNYISILIFILLNGLFAQNRKDIIIDDNWRFTRENASDAEQINYNDSYWEKISLPHSWNSRDGQDGGNDYYRGTGWYRRWFTVENKFKNQRIYLKFEGSSINTEVFVNGISAGFHKGSFGAFCFDITQRIKFGKRNILSVKVNNSKDSTISPLRGDFTMFGGIYRSVHLLILNPVSISPIDYASSGIYVTQKSVTDGKAEIEIITKLLNNEDQNRNITIKYSLQDDHGNKIKEISSPLLLQGKSNSDHKQNFIIDNPVLWNGKLNPYLYLLKVTITEKNKVIDNLSESIGLRSFAVDPDKGFYLNNKPYKLYGVNRHQDRENKGWAIGKKEHQEDYSLIEELGCTSLRLAHYQQSEYFYDLCDKGGMVVWAELALVDDVNGSPDFLATCRQQLTELIKQNYNHPSIIFWSMENELVPDNDTSLYNNIVAELNSLAKQLDPVRLTTVATRSKYDCDFRMNNITDVLGINVYRGWYEKKPEDFSLFIDDFHKKFPHRSISISEYGAGGNINQHEWPVKKPNPRGEWHPEEWQSVLHELTWKAMAERPYIWGSFIWNMFDFASDGRSEGDYHGMNDKGLVTYNRKIKKDVFYYYKASWNSDPMVYITSRRFTPRTSSLTDIKVYSNCSSVKLYLNDIPLEEKLNNANIFVWENITLKQGTNTIRAVGSKNGKVLSDECIWEYSFNKNEISEFKNN